MKFDMSQAWNQATNMLRANTSVVAVVAGVFFFLPYLVMNLALSGQTAELQAALAGGGAPEAAMEQIIAFYGRIWWVFLLVGLVQIVGTIGLIALLSDYSRPTVGEALKLGLLAILPYFAAQVILGVGLVVLLFVPVGAAAASGSAALIALVVLAALVAGCYLMTKFSLVPAVVGREKVLNPITMLTRSWTLTKGNSLRIFLFYVLIVALLIVISLVLSLFVGLLSVVLGGTIGLWVSGIFSAAINAVFVTVMLAVIASVHEQLAGASPAGLSQTFE